MSSRRRLTLILTIGAVAWVVLVATQPVHRRAAQVALIVAASGAWAGLVALAWRRRRLRAAVLSTPVLLLVPFVLPRGEIDREELRTDYVERVTAFDGTRYVWGGESALGIDCSGLPRRALRDALLAYGLRHASGAAFRLFAEQWWHDASAQALGEGHREFTTRLDVLGRIDALDTTALAPGDLAVTNDSRHLLVYVGRGRWAQAEPGLGRVVTLHGRNDPNEWFEIPVTTHRWTVLADGR